MIGLVFAFVGAHALPLALAVLALIYRRRWRIADMRMHLYMDTLIKQEADWLTASRLSWEHRKPRRPKRPRRAVRT
ncbi:MAG TPA: hypothetical protein VFO94_19325 [Gammaproteobacteria bacterium]|nr:hypothetical protein [Gammaproteobacteria bacterium]